MYEADRVGTMWCEKRVRERQRHSLDRYLRSCVSEEAKINTLVDFDMWSTALDDNLAGMKPSELVEVHDFDAFGAPEFI